ncbi:MAG: hypothetical protein U0T56_06215 [Ferruginibacter sp.]
MEYTRSSFNGFYLCFVFAIVYWRDLNRLPVRSVSHQWFVPLVFSIFSSLGAFARWRS